ncbi:WSC domain-containing protein [Trichoderma austrokoningii]
MANQQHEGSGLRWPSQRLLFTLRRSLVIASVVFLIISIICFVGVATIETAKLERRALAERQFQLGGLLGGMFREAIDTPTAKTSPAAHTANQDSVASSSTPIRVTEAATSISRLPETTRMSESKASLSNPDTLLETLANAVKEAFMESDQPSASAAKQSQKNALSDMIGSQPNALALSKDSSPPAFLQKSRSSSARNLPTPSVGLLGGVWGDSMTLRIHNARAAPEKLPTDSSTDTSFLGELSKIVAEISDIDPAAAAKLTDTVLDALHVDSSAVAAAIPKVANQAAVAASDLLPLVIPAVAKAMNQSLPPLPPVSTLDMTETLNKVLQQGTTVINDLSKALEDITDPALLSVVNQLALIVSAVADYLNKPLCAIDQVLDGTSFEEVIPCDEVETGSSTSASQITTLAAPGISETATRTSDHEGITTPASPKPYLSSTPTNESPTKASNTAPADGEDESETPTKTSSAHPSCPTCPSCDGPDSLDVHQPPDPSIGPCPGRGFKCDECLDGWFCPPQETPAQVVPCGLGWPCYHCPGGWFCELTETSSPTPPPGSVASTGSPSTKSAATPTNTSKNEDLPEDWSYLGCFQDAISRTLLGAKPVDYLQGDVSSKECVEHCTSGGYRLAGTENGRECWCGTSIRDDAVRLPESQCGKPCQGQATELCGGSWAIDIFISSDENKSLQKPPGNPIGSFMFRPLSKLRGGRGKTDRQRLYAAA